MKRLSLCGIDCANCELRGDCRGCAKTGGRPFGGACVVARCLQDDAKALCARKRGLIAAFNALGIEDMETVSDQNALKGSFVNIEYTLPNGQIVRFWDDNRIYFGNQLRKKGGGRCYGIVADENYLMVSEYGENGADAEAPYFSAGGKPIERKRTCGTAAFCKGGRFLCPVRKLSGNGVQLI